ncbi:MAG: hydrogenase maturation protease [Planctomycetes bacterium]|nr:hydrogenase maturation protease [Planctomycetota bacterium]MBL7144904.1 hydrogenase maturation protease [Phycisphaerae bacterium]
MGPEWYDKSVLILGCGNVLLEDDGFGPAVAQQLQRDFTIPSDICVLDTGTSVREILFDTILSDKKPSKIVIIDAMDCGLEPGELFNLDLDSYPKVKLDDFSLHQIPTSNLLRELRDLCGIEVSVVACQVAGACDSVNPGLSEPVNKAVGQAAEMIAKDYFK